MGVIAGDERAVSLIPQRIVEGNYLGDDQKSGVVIGTDLARKLAVRVGAKVVLMIQAVEAKDAETRRRWRRNAEHAAAGERHLSHRYPSH